VYVNTNKESAESIVLVSLIKSRYDLIFILGIGCKNGIAYIKKMSDNT
jgi:hypothetical protein